MTPIELRDFWNEVIENNSDIEIFDNEWKISVIGPNRLSDKVLWRVKPKRKIIDMSCMIGSNYDIEWSNGNHWSMSGNGKLINGDRNPLYIKCRVRQKHIHFYKKHTLQGNKAFLSEELGLPKGLQIEVYDQIGYLTGFEVLGCLEGWSYE